MSTKGHSTKMEVGDQATYDVSSVWTALFSKVTGLTPPKIEGEDIDVSHMLSPDQFEEFDPGWANGGEVELDAQFDKDQQEFVYGLFRVPRGFRMTFVDGSKWNLNAYIKAFANEVERKGIVSVKVTIKISGKPQYVKATP